MNKEAETGIIAEYTYNTNGVRIKKCCASCQTHTSYSETSAKRICTLDDCKKIVRKDDLCRYWVLSDMMAKIKLNGCRL